MRVLANLRRLVGALFGIVFRRKTRRSDPNTPLVSHRAKTPASSSRVAVAESRSAGTTFASQEASAGVAVGHPDSKVERQEDARSDVAPFGNGQAAGDAHSASAPGVDVDDSPAPVSATPPEATAHLASMEDDAVSQVVPAIPLTAGDIYAASAGAAVLEQAQPAPEATVETSAETEEAVPPPPEIAAATVAADELIPTAEVTEGLSLSTHSVTEPASVVPEVSQTAEALPDAAISETSPATAEGGAQEVVSEIGVDAALGPHVNGEGEATSEPEGRAPSTESRLTIDQPDPDAVLVVEAEGDSIEETDDPLDESVSAGGATKPPDVGRTDQRRSSTWQHRPEPSSEYSGVWVSELSTNYRTWNRAIAEHLLLKSPIGTALYLTITPRILAGAFMEVQGTTQDAEEARFSDAVSEMYRVRVLGSRARLRTLRRVGDDGLPECIAFLALTVLAAYRMHGDDEATGLAYYLRLSELLQVELSGQYPTGFDPLVFESLWHFLRDWLSQRDGSLALPAPETGSRRFVGLPLAHVPLRSLDIDKLPEFFVWAGYQPSNEVTTERVGEDFARWVRARGALTPTGVAAFADARRSAVLAEIRAELDSWDGTCNESFSRRSASVEILFDPVQHRPELFYVPRRPAGFPARFDDGVHVFEGSDDGWYGRVSISPPDGPDLAKGFTWQVAKSGVEFLLRRAGTSVISMVPGDDYSGFKSARGLRRNAQCAVLCQEDVANAAAEYLSHVTQRLCKPLQRRDLPAGWTLFPGIVARRVADTPAGLESLDVQAHVGLIPAGGIRLGNRWSWLHGAPPRIIVTGSEAGVGVTVDGRPADVDQDGMLQAGGSLSTLGAHVIQVGPVRRTVEIVEPSIHVRRPTAHTRRDGASAPVMLALPAGRWTVVGVAPGQVARTKYALRNGTIVACDFLPAWAIRVGAQRGATVLNVFPGAGAPPAPDTTRARTSRGLSGDGMRGWASSIYDAAIRRPQIGSLRATGDPAAAIASWKGYARCANQIKRTIRTSYR
jgi:hypothetical protein